MTIYFRRNDMKKRYSRIEVFVMVCLVIITISIGHDCPDPVLKCPDKMHRLEFDKYIVEKAPLHLCKGTYVWYYPMKTEEDITAWQAIKNRQSVTSPKRTPTFDDLLDAIEQVESGGDPNAVCPDGCCIGAYQISAIYFDDVNRLARLLNSDHADFPYTDRWNKDYSRAMTRFYIKWYGYGKTFEDMARIHHGGPDGWRDDPQWFVRNRDYTVNEAIDKIVNCQEYWFKVEERMEAPKNK